MSGPAPVPVPPPPPDPHSSWVERAREGDPAAWRALYDAHAGRLVLWLRQSPTGDPAADADDLAMEAWTVAASKIADFHGDDDAFAGWLFGIARNHVMNIRRRSARRATYATADLPETTLPMETVTGPAETAEAIRHALAALPRREGEAIACIDVVDLDVETTARILGISRPAVRVARQRGLKRLRASGWAL
ncbi:RNA polymerase sigma factor [Nocardioides nematodiphilus]|uniref:RNA polymerase sigma factor n=1 Tax=Nocardioides nematodiphilus TaxID=2849669 RepID=UPI001CD9579A|nr:sigma-70 family RNA polymerase sigma factor [Nocardioides nematodiphilus]MCA1982767.1 sigma-70 family RNA polymerase sigma factor [Nocardioides nematodiphilus]